MTVRSSIDTGALAAALRRPGIDPRVWISPATVEDVGFDAENGVFADVRLIPDGQLETARIGSDYAGPGFGSFSPPRRGDRVLVAIPHGDPGYGPVIFARYHTAGAPPPPEFGNEETPDPTDATENPTMRLEDGRTLRLVMKAGASLKLEISGPGSVEVDAKDGATVLIASQARVTVQAPDVVLGSAGGPSVARIGDFVSVVLPPMIAVTDPITMTQIGVVVPAPPVLPSPTGALVGGGQIVSGAQSVKAGP